MSIESYVVCPCWHWMQSRFLQNCPIEVLVCQYTFQPNIKYVKFIKPVFWHIFYIVSYLHPIFNQFHQNFISIKFYLLSFLTLRRAGHINSVIKKWMLGNVSVGWQVEGEDREGESTDEGSCPSSGGHQENNTSDTCASLVSLNWIGTQAKVTHRSVLW